MARTRVVPASGGGCSVLAVSALHTRVQHALRWIFCASASAPSRGLRALKLAFGLGSLHARRHAVEAGDGQAPCSQEVGPIDGVVVEAWELEHPLAAAAVADADVARWDFATVH